MAKSLRKYQEEAIGTIQKKFNKGVSRQLLVLPTGAGKTFTAVKAIEQFGFKKKLWVTHTIELLEQSGAAFLQELYPQLDIQMMIDTYGGLANYIEAVKKMDMFSDLSENEVIRNIGIVKAEAFDIEADIVLASAQTLHRRLDRMPADLFDAVIVDEAHLFAAKTFVKPLQYFQPKLLLGLTATPYRADGAKLGDIFDEIVYQYNIGDAINDGYLCEIDAIACKTDLNLDDVRTTAGEFNQKDLTNLVDTPVRNKFLVDKYKQYAEGKQNLVFCVDVQHAQNVCKTFQEAGYRAEFLVGDEELTPDRKAVINRFKTGQTQVLVNVMILTAGFDYPGIKCLTLACPTKSLTKFYQQIGRATRTLSGTIDNLDSIEARKAAIRSSAKPNAIVLDIVDTTSKHRIVNTWTLDSNKPIEERTFTTSDKKDKLLDVKKKREMETTRKADQRVNLFALPLAKVSTSIRMTEPATPAQLDFLQRLGYDTASNTYTKGTASELLTNHAATEKQVSFLKWKGYDTSRGVTIGEAKLAFEEIKTRETKKETQTHNKKEAGTLPIDGLF